MAKNKFFCKKRTGIVINSLDGSPIQAFVRKMPPHGETITEEQTEKKHDASRGVNSVS